MVRELRLLGRGLGSTGRGAAECCGGAGPCAVVFRQELAVFAVEGTEEREGLLRALWGRRPFERAPHRVGQPDSLQLPGDRSDGGQAARRQERDTLLGWASEPCVTRGSGDGYGRPTTTDRSIGSRPGVLDGVFQQ